MAFTDAWHEGETALEGVVARLFPSLGATLSALGRADSVIATSADPGVAGASRCRCTGRCAHAQANAGVAPAAPRIVDCRPGPVLSRARAWTTHLCRLSCTVSRRATRRQGLWRRALCLHAVGRKFAISLSIGARVAAREPVGRIGDWVCRTPLGGVLRVCGRRARAGI